MDRSNHDFLDERQDSQEQEEDERPEQRWNNERKIFNSPSKVEDTSHQHKLCAESGLYYGKTQRSVSDSVRLKNRSFEIDNRREANIEVGCEDDKLLSSSPALSRNEALDFTPPSVGASG